MGNEADSLDMTQGALEKAFSRLGQLKDPVLFKTWLGRRAMRPYFLWFKEFVV